MSTLTDEVHRDIRRRILTGEFHVGDRLAEVRLATLLGVSRTPVREALHRLEAEELVTSAPGGGVRPAIPDLDRMADLYDVRLRLEALSVERACSNGADVDALHALRSEWLDLRANPSQIETGDFVYLEESFHIGLAAAGENGALATMLDELNQRIRIIRVQDFLVVGRIDQTITEHLGIVDAIIDRDLDQALGLMDAHINVSAEHVRDRAMAVIMRMTTGGPSVFSLQGAGG